MDTSLNYHKANTIIVTFIKLSAHKTSPCNSFPSSFLLQKKYHTFNNVLCGINTHAFVSTILTQYYICKIGQCFYFLLKTFSVITVLLFIKNLIVSMFKKNVAVLYNAEKSHHYTVQQNILTSARHHLRSSIILCVIKKKGC